MGGTTVIIISLLIYLYAALYENLLKGDVMLTNATSSVVLTLSILSNKTDNVPLILETVNNCDRSETKI